MKTSSDTKTEILRTAMERFASQGYNAVSMRAIAAEVGISAPALYNHYASKQALYEAAVSATFADKAPRLLAALDADSPPLSQLDAFVHALCHSIERDPAFRALLQRELLDGDDGRLAFLGHSVFRPVQQRFMALLETLRPGCDALLLSEFVFGMVKQHFDLVPLHPHLDLPDGGQRPADVIAGLAMQVLTPYFKEHAHA